MDMTLACMQKNLKISFTTITISKQINIAVLQVFDTIVSLI